jgi:alkanesulfonate monooxygenase SsuD/methylene tetrahydromethanopterin reductase-like flavin-dependent oxidoreductase (luciferase family)
MAYDPSKIHRIDYKGQHHQLTAYGSTHPSPQRTPVIFQAGASKSGIDFAGKHAEAIYTDYSTVPMLKEYVEQVRAAAVRHGRPPNDVKIFAAMCPILGRTLEEAQAKHDKAFSLISIQSGMAKFGGYTNIDLSKYPLKEPFNLEVGEADNLITGVLKDFNERLKSSKEPFTPESIGKAGGFNTTPKPLGTAEMVADELQEWFEKTGIDGFNLVCGFCVSFLPLLSHLSSTRQISLRIFSIHRCV